MRANLPAEERDRSIEAVVARLRFGDSDGDDHDIAANEIERLRAESAHRESYWAQFDHVPKQGTRTPSHD